MRQHQESEQGADIYRVLRRDREIHAQRVGAVDGEALERTHARLNEEATWPSRSRALAILATCTSHCSRCRVSSASDLTVLMPAKRLIEEGPALRLGLDHGAGRLARCRQHHNQPQNDKSAERDDDGRQDRTEEKHHRQKDEQSQRIQDRTEQLPRQEGSDPENLIHVVADDADLRALEVVDRQAQNLVEHVFREASVDPRGNDQDQIGSQVSKNRLERR